jgi:hypothetical protein
VAATPAADLDNDGTLELLVPTLAGRVYVVEGDGSLMAGWPRDAGSMIVSSPAIADITGDGIAEVIVGTQRGVSAWNGDGLPVIDWPKETGDWVVASPAIGDLGGDGLLDVAVESYDRSIHVWSASGAATADASVFLA